MFLLIKGTVFVLYYLAEKYKIFMKHKIESLDLKKKKQIENFLNRLYKKLPTAKYMSGE